MKKELLERLKVVELWIQFYEEDGIHYGSNYTLWKGRIAERDAILAKLAELEQLFFLNRPLLNEAVGFSIIPQFQHFVKTFFVTKFSPKFS